MLAVLFLTTGTSATDIMHSLISLFYAFLLQPPQFHVFRYIDLPSFVGFPLSRPRNWPFCSFSQTFLSLYLCWVHGHTTEAGHHSVCSCVPSTPATCRTSWFVLRSLREIFFAHLIIPILVLMTRRYFSLQGSCLRSLHIYWWMSVQ